jgi:hypothetical protein
VAKATGKLKVKTDIHLAIPIPSCQRMLTCISTRGPVGLSELEDYDYKMTNPRRRTNSFSAAAGHNLYKSKFEAVDPEAVIEFDENLHGAAGMSAEEMADNELEKMSSSSSAGTVGSVEEEEAAKSQ